MLEPRILLSADILPDPALDTESTSVVPEAPAPVTTPAEQSAAPLAAGSPPPGPTSPANPAGGMANALSPPPSLDVDQNGMADAFTDGFLIIRHLLNLTGAALVQGVVDPSGDRIDPDEITTYLDSVESTLLDVDANNQADAFTDGMLILRYLFGFTGQALTNGVVDPAGSRTEPQAIIDFLNGFNPNLDSTPPDILANLSNDTGASMTDGITFDPTVTGTVTDVQPISQFLAGFDAAPVEQFVDVLGDLQPDGSFTFTPSRLADIHGGPLAEGMHTLNLFAMDQLGNTSSIVEVPFTLDTMGPSITSFELDPAFDSDPLGDDATNQDLITLIGQTDPHTMVELLETGATTISDATGTFSFDNLSLFNGPNFFTVEAVDVAGNTGMASTTITRFVGEAISFEDPDLEEAIRGSLGIPDGQIITTADMDLLIALSAESEAIQSLVGLEFATNLESLNLFPGDFANPATLPDLDPILGLSSLESLSLVNFGMDNADLAPLGQLGQLRQLDLRYNDLTDITPLAGINTLTDIQVFANPITDISPFAGRLVNFDLQPAGLEHAQTVTDVARALHYLPLDIFEYVLGNFELELYPGAMKGAQAVIETGAGNDFDQADLFVQLLEESGIDARFASGRASVFNSTLQNWLGVKDNVISFSALSTLGLNPQSTLFGLQTTFDHTWVEAFLTLPGETTGQWIPLDPSWKFRDFQDGIDDVLDLVPFDEAGYLSQTRTELTHEFYAQQVADFLAANSPDVSLSDFAHDGPIIPINFTSIPTALPYSVAGPPTTFDEIPAFSQHRIALGLNQGSTVHFAEEFNVPDISLDRITVTYAPSSPGFVIPELRIGGNVMATGSPVQEGSFIGFTVDHLDPGDNIADRTFTYFRQAGQILALGLDANQVSDTMLNRVQREVNEATFAQLNGQPVSTDAQIGSMLSLAVLKWFSESNRAEDIIYGLTGAIGLHPTVESGLTSSEPIVDIFPDLQNPAVPRGATMDLKNISTLNLPTTLDLDTIDMRNNIIQMNTSAQEHAIWEDLLNTPSISTIKSLQLANERGIPIFEIDSSNAATLIPQLTLSQGPINDITNRVNQGSTVTVPRDPTPLGNWDGVGYISRGPGGAFGFLIFGGLSSSGVESISGGQATQDPQSAPDVVEGNCPNCQTVGDPVIVSNGNVTRDELDIALPGIGLPLNFARHFDSQSTEDIGLGPGWTHSYSGLLTFQQDGSIIWRNSLGQRFTFTPDGQGGFTVPNTLFGTFSATQDGFIYRNKDGQSTTFDNTGKMVEISDRNGNALALAYDAQGHLATVTDADSPNRQLTFTHTNGLITAVTDFTGRTWTYAYDTNNRLSQVSSPGDLQTSAQTVTYDYYTDPVRDGLLHHITQPDGGVITYTYYANGRAFEVTGPEGFTHSLSYNLFRQQTTFTDERGNPTIHEYNLDGNEVLRINPDQSRETFLWDNGLLLQQTDALGQVETFQYDALGNVTETLDRAGILTTFTYDPVFSNVTSITRPGGRITLFDYDQNGNLISVADALGNLTTFTYDDNGQLLTTTAPRGTATPDPDDFTTAFSYNEAGQVLTQSTDFPTTDAFTYDDRGNLLSRTDANGNTTTFTYDLLDRLIATTDPLGNVTTFAYDIIGNLNQVVDPLGRTTDFAYDLRQLLVETHNPDGTLSLQTFDPARNLSSRTDELGHATRFDYDERNRLAGSELFESNTGLTIQDQNFYDANGRLIAQEDANGNRTEFTYDAGDRLIAITDPLGFATTFTYDEAGNLETTTDRRGAVTTFTYDLLDRITQTRGEEGFITTTDYDENGNTILTTRYDVTGLAVIPDDPRTLPDALKRSVQVVYDVLDRPVEIIDPLGQAAQTVFDPGGRVIETIDELGRRALFGYDAADRLTSVTDPLLGIVTTDYDAVGNVTTITDQLGRTATFAYDTRDRQVSTTDALGGTTSFQYDPVGNVTGITDALGRETTLHYDDRNLLLATTDALGGLSTFFYDRNGNQTATIDEIGNLTRFFYDPLNRIRGQVDGAGGFSSFTYDPEGNLVTATDPLGQATNFAYDLRGRLVETTDALGGTTSNIYDALGNVTTTIDELGRTTSFEYDDLNRVTTITDPLGGITALTYDPVSNLLTTTDALNRTTQFTYDELDRVITSTDPTGNRTTTVYDAVGNILSTTDELNRTTTFTYDDLDRLTGITDPLGGSTTTDYDAVGNITAVTDALGRTTTFVYDDLDRLFGVVDAGGNVSFNLYDPASNLVAAIDPLGRFTTFAYDGLNRLVATTDALGNVSTTTYDAASNIVAVTDELGHTTTFTYDALNRLVASTDALGNTTQTAYDAASNIVSITDARGNTTAFTYDDLDRLTDTTDALGQTTQTAYDAVGNIIAITDALNRTTSFAYDDLDRLTTTTDALGHITTNTYDAVGNLLSTTDPLLRTTTLTYDDLDRLTSITDPLLNQTTTTYDAVGNVLSVTDALGRVTTFTYDELDRLTTSTDALGNQTLTEYDAVGNIVTITDALGRVTSFAYDPLNRLTATTDALGGLTLTTYDAAGNVSAVTDALGRTTTFGYDDVNRLVTNTDALGNTSRTVYDEVGNVVGLTNALGHTTTFTYDAVNQLTGVTDALGNSSTTQYDAVGNIIATTDELGRTTTFAYDDLDRLITQTDPLLHSTTFAYDDVGNLRFVTDALGNVSETQYDELDRQIRAIDANGAATDFAYDAVGNLTQLTDPVGNDTIFVYDALNRLVSETNELGDTRFLVYDAVGNLIQITDRNQRVRAFTYDELNRQTEEQWQDALGNTERMIAFTYDAVGQLLTATDPDSTFAYTYDAAGRLTTVDTTGTPGVPDVVLTFTYDAVGNRLSATETIDGLVNGMETFTYDALNRQTSISQTGSLITSKRAEFTYDAAGKLTTIERFADLEPGLPPPTIDLAVASTDGPVPIDDTLVQSFDSTNVPVNIVDNATVISTLEVTDAGDSLADINITLDITHTFDSDLDVFLISPSGTRVALFTRIGGSSDNFTQTTLDDEAKTTITSGAAPFTGSFQPQEALKAFEGEDPNGIWTLEITDNFFLDQGTLNSWSLDITSQSTTTSTVKIAGATGAITDIDVTVDIDHTFDGDLDVVLVSPSGTRVQLFADVGGSGDNFTNTTLDDEANTAITNGVAPFTGRFRPEGSLAALDGEDPNGIWTLEIQDTSFLDEGTLNGWSLAMTLVQPLGTETLATTTNVYDDAGRLIQITHEQGPVVLAQYDYTYDDVNRITEVTSLADGTSTFTYDDRGQELTATHSFQDDEGFTYDENGNRTNTGFQTGLNNQLLSDGTFNYEYDGEGNRIKRTEIATGAVTEYEYDHRNRLIRVTDRASEGGPATQVVEFTYDVFGRRIAKSVDLDGDGAQAATIDRFVYDGDHIALQFDGQGDLTTRYFHGPFIDQILGEETADNQVLWTLTDHQNTVRDLADSNGTILNHRTFDSFGSITSETNPNVDHIFAYTGREFDQETGLSYYRARYYDNKAARFVSEDPIGFEGQDANLYRYLGNSPANFVDPSGNFSFNPQTAINFAINTVQTINQAKNFTQQLGDFVNNTSQQVINSATNLGQQVVNFGTDLAKQVSATTTNIITQVGDFSGNLAQQAAEQVGQIIQPTEDGGIRLQAFGEEVTFTGKDINTFTGTLQAIGGATEIVGGLSTCAATFGAGCVVALKGFDDFQAGLRQAISGEQVNTFTFDLAFKLSGGNPFVATAFDIIGPGGIVKGASKATDVVKLLSRVDLNDARKVISNINLKKASNFLAKGGDEVSKAFNKVQDDATNAFKKIANDAVNIKNNAQEFVAQTAKNTTKAFDNFSAGAAAGFNKSSKQSSAFPFLPADPKFSENLKATPRTITISQADLVKGPKRFFFSSDPDVGELATEIESQFPGLVKEVNKIVFDPVTGKRVTDLDIVLENAVIQVKSGDPGNLIDQIQKSEKATGLPTIGFGKKVRGGFLSTKVGENFVGEELLVTSDKEILFEVIQP